MTQNKKCPEGSNCPYKGFQVGKAIRSMPDYLKGQETANTELTEAYEKEALLQYQRTGLTPDQINKLLSSLHGECWLCKHSKPYNISPTRKLSTCELGFPNRNKGTNQNTTAMIRNKDCNCWELKEL